MSQNITQKDKTKALYIGVKFNEHSLSGVAKLGRISLDPDAIDTRQFMNIAQMIGVESTNAERYLRLLKAADKKHKEITGNWLYNSNK